MAKKKDDTDILKEIRERFKEAYDFWDEQYQKSIDDLNFADGEGKQWPTDLKAQRQADQRPCLEINKIPAYADQVIGDIRQNEPAIKVKPVDSKADPDTAEILTGLIRNIEVQNDGEIADDTAAESAVYCGIGAYRIGTKYTDDDAFEQDITKTRIKNPFTSYPDPAAQEWQKEDARYWFVTEKIPRDEFKRQYPDAALMPFEGGKDTNRYWGDDKSIRIVEYWVKEPFKKTLYLVRKNTPDPMTGQMIPGKEIYVTEEKPDLEKLAQAGENWEILKEREVESYKIKWYKANHSEILEGPVDWPGRYIPIVMVYGKELNIEGKTNYRGIVRNAKDPQRLYNYSRSTSAEVIALAPKAPFIISAKQIGQYQKIWDNAHKKSFPYLPFESDPSMPGLIPQRAQPIGVNTGIQNEIVIADQEMHDTTGLQQASLGQKSNEKSGKAIKERKMEGDVSSYAYYDNLGRAKKYEGKIYVDLIPKIYDTPRILRILNRDGTDKFVPVNQPIQERGQNGEAMQKIYDLTVGKYDVVVSIGPSYTTERQEAAENMLSFLGILPPQLAGVVADLVAKNLDWPGADEWEKRFKALLPPQLQGGDENAPPAPPPPPNPVEILTTKKAEEEAKGLALDNEKKFEELKRMKAGVDLQAKGGASNA